MMASRNVRWYGDRVMKDLNRGLAANMERACVVLVRDIVKKFPGSGKAGASKAYREAHRSKPGEIPHVQIGNLKKSIGYKVVKEAGGKIPKGRVGVMTAVKGNISDSGIAEALKYALYLEMGTERMHGPRPYLRPALDRNKREIEKQLGRRVF